MRKISPWKILFGKPWPWFQGDWGKRWAFCFRCLQQGSYDSTIQAHCGSPIPILALSGALRIPPTSPRPDGAWQTLVMVREEWTVAFTQRIYTGLLKQEGSWSRWGLKEFLRLKLLSHPTCKLLPSMPCQHRTNASLISQVPCRVPYRVNV